MRTLKELYSILLEYYTETTSYHRNYNNHGGYLCNAIQRLEDDRGITSEECELLANHFQAQRPTKNINSELFNHSLQSNDGSIVWFDWNVKDLSGVKDSTSGVNVRIELLNLIISKL